MAYQDEYGHDFCDGELEPVKKTYIVKEMMGDHYGTFFETDTRTQREIATYEVEQERNIDHARDNAI